MTREPVLLAETTVDVPAKYARSWFLALAEHPERYKFESHGGFTFTEGEFGEPGARFETRERFAGVARLTLKFELTEVAQHRFTFQLRSPIQDVWGYFELVPIAEQTTILRLGVGSDHQLRRSMLQMPPIRGAIQHQIEGEIANIAESMMSLYSSEREA